MPARTPKFGLGTVQFGVEYGIANVRGRPSLEEISNILMLAREGGVTVLDTAASYGSSEKVIGLCEEADFFDIVTKTGHFNRGERGAACAASVISSFELSLARLRRNCVYGLLVHVANDLLNDDGDYVFDALTTLKQRGRVKKIGVSVYSPEEIEAVVDRYPVDLVQTPYNVFDQRLVSRGTLCCLKAKGVEVHTRSAFLQGLLLLAPDQLGSYFEPIRAHLDAFRKAAADASMSPLEACVDFALRPSAIDVAIFGVAALGELRELFGAIKASRRASLDFSEFALEDVRFLHPQNWPSRQEARRIDFG